MIKTDYSMNAAKSNVHQNTSWSTKSLHLSSKQMKIIENRQTSFMDVLQVAVTTIAK